MRAERLRRQEINLAPKQILKIEGQLHKIIERLAAKRKLNQNIHIAGGILLITNERAKHAETLNAEVG